MARPVVLSNGGLHVGLNNFGLVHDFYFPYVGLENHSADKSMRHKVGVWVDGVISWLDDGSWDIQSRTAEGALIGHTRAYNSGLGVLLEFDDVVDNDVNVFVRNIHIVNTTNINRDIRIFMHQVFAIGDSRSNTDTAQYLPDSNAVLHYRGRRAFVISGRHHNNAWFDQHSVGLFGIEGHEGTYRDADDGELAGSSVEHGRVDSTIRFKCELKAYDSYRVHYWIAAGESIREALRVHKFIDENGAQTFLHSTAMWWHSWLAPVRKASERLPITERPLFIHSAMVIKAHIDNHGAVIASTDSAMLNYSRDAYAYCWPRDASYALWPLIRLGYSNEPRRFFEFMREALNPNGYLMHKYQADGAVGSSWHTYVHGAVNSAPIQEDETALTLFMFAQYYSVQKDRSLLEEFYASFVVPMADFLSGYIDNVTGLPFPSYDLWEENFMISTYTTAVTFAALLASAELAEDYGDDKSAVKWRSASDDIQQNAYKHLFNDKRNYFYKGIRFGENKERNYDETIDLASFYGAYMFGLFAADSQQIETSYATLRGMFKTDSYGLPRYENDNYNRVAESGLGNYWYIASLWVAQYAYDSSDKDFADAIINWVRSHTDTSLMLAEQLNPATSQEISVSPLVWSHAEYMTTMLDMMSNGVKE